MAAVPLLDVRDLTTIFPTSDGVVRAVDQLTYQVHAGEAVAIVGESGSGKSVGVRSLLGLVPPPGRVVAGSAEFAGRDLLQLDERALRRIRGREIGMVFQDALRALNPAFTLQRQLTEHLRWHKLCSAREAHDRALASLRDVGIDEPERRLRQYPFQLSGGMRQRAMMAMALVARPKLLIADEPTTAVDVTLQRQILDILAELKRQGMAIILITHDLGVARHFCDQVVVMYAGRAIERGEMRAFIDAPLHPYSRGLLDSTFEPGRRAQRLSPVPGNPPDLAHLPPGCPFEPRCALADEGCRRRRPMLVASEPGREVACWKVAPGVEEHVAGSP